MTPLLAIALVACASDPTLVSGVTREGGVYTTLPLSIHEATQTAVEQCQRDGNKKLRVLTSTTQRGKYSGVNLVTLVFSCE